MEQIFCILKRKYIEKENSQEYRIVGNTDHLGNNNFAILRKGTDLFLQEWGAIFPNVYFENKINEYKIIKILTELFTKLYSETSIEKLSEEFDIHPKNILLLANGKSWQHVSLKIINKLSNTKSNYTTYSKIEIIRDTFYPYILESQRRVNNIPLEMEKFVKRDYHLNKLSPKKISVKYFLTEKSINNFLKIDDVKKIKI